MGYRGTALVPDRRHVRHAAIAAIAAWRSANATSRAADRADRTAQRTAEILGSVILFVTNDSEHSAIVTAARIERPDDAPTAVVSGIPAVIKPHTLVIAWVSASLGPFAPLTPDARPGDAPSELLMAYELPA